MKKWLLACLLCLFCLVGCGTSSHVRGIITDTSSQFYTYPCGKVTCGGRHYYMVVDGKMYQDDGDTYAKGDDVSFTYNTVWGVSDFYDDTYHKPDNSWVVVLIVIGVVVVIALAWLVIASGAITQRDYTKSSGSQYFDRTWHLPRDD